MESSAKQSKCNDSLDLDDILPQVGEFGKYQKLMLWFVCLPACFPCGFCAFNQLFMTDVPEHWCTIPSLANTTIELRKKLAIPFDNETFSKCERYAVNWTKIVEENDLNYNDIQTNISWPKEKCLDGWEYNKSEISSSIVIDFDLVCERDIYPTIGLTALNIGGPVGVYFFGFLNDRIGRKKSFFVCLTTVIFGSILTATAQDFLWWAISRVIVGLTVPAIYQIPFIISLELVGPNYRSFVTVMTCMFYTVGLMILAGITYLIRDWVHLTLATSVPFFLYYFYWFVLPESPRWLLARGKFEEAAQTLQKLAQINGKEVPPSFQLQLEQRIFASKTNEETIKHGGLKDLCFTPNMRLKTFLITVSWFSTETVYVGLSYYSPALGNNQYLSFFMSSLVEIPSYLLCWFLLDKWGRRWPLSLSMTISGLCCIGTMFVASGDEKTILVLYLASKWAISASFLIIYPFAGELYPTQLRGIGIGASAYIGGLGLIIIPFINYLKTNLSLS
ncbi:carcinine transporter isoform X2 [Agrilus planipennis]|uniref:Carcinine transporter isoform X2 n=1 Tax=Agrilus planipennis TaxID=224129 RepID=A0A1W4WZY3_AGRPL|nr:carcinine transporter isoform X2 [Agrilus planipennis]